MHANQSIQLTGSQLAVSYLDVLRPMAQFRQQPCHDPVGSQKEDARAPLNQMFSSPSRLRTSWVRPVP